MLQLSEPGSAREIREKIAAGGIHRPTAFALKTAWPQIQRYLAWGLLILLISFFNVSLNFSCQSQHPLEEDVEAQQCHRLQRQGAFFRMV